MKPTTKTAVIGMILAAGAFIIMPHFTQSASAATRLAGEQYKVLIVTQYSGRPEALEEALNQLGADGWKVRAGAMWAIILAK